MSQREPDARLAAGNLATQRLSRRRDDDLLVQRKADSCHCGGTCDECAQPALKTDAALTSTPPTVARGALPGGGRPLEAGLADTMGRRFGHDLRGVRIHDDSEGHQFAAQFGARAVTVGRDVYFARGHYNPGTARGDHDLVHELAHVVQQKDVAGGPGLGAGVSLDQYRALERAADESADRVLAGGTPSVMAGTRRATVQRVGESASIDTTAMANLFVSYGILPPIADADILDEIMAKAARKDADWITDKILEVWVDDEDERNVLDVLWKYARFPNPRGGNYLDVILDAIKSYAYWFDYLVGESIKGNCIDKLFAEMEDDHQDELRRLVDNFSLRYAGYRGRGDITRTSGAVTAFLPSEVKTRLSALSQKLAGKTVVFGTAEEIAEINSLYAQIRVKTLGLVSIPSILLQPSVARAAPALLLLIPVAAALAAAIAEALLLVLVVIAAILLVITLIDIMERLASRPKPAEPQPEAPAKPVDVPKPGGPGGDVIPISRHPRYEPKFPPETTFDPFPIPDPKPRTRPDEDRRRSCRIDPVAPLGGDPLANIYCEFATSDWSGMDYRVTTPEGQYAVFDAFTGGTLYECKCGYLRMVRDYLRGERSGINRWRYFVAAARINDLDEQARRQHFVASRCGLPLRWYVSNAEVAAFLNERWFGSPMVLDVPWTECD